MGLGWAAQPLGTQEVLIPLLSRCYRESVSTIVDTEHVLQEETDLEKWLPLDQAFALLVQCF